MIKVMWFLKRAEHISLADFRRWWTVEHAPAIRAEKVPHLVRYVVNVRVDVDDLPGRPADEPEWDGVAEEWFPTRAAFEAIYGQPERPTRDDTLAHTSRMQRLIVDEHPFI